MTNDFIISKWFAEHSFKSVEDITLRDLKPTIESIAEYYAQNSVIVDVDFVINYFDNMSLPDVCNFLNECIACKPEVTNDEDKAESHKYTTHRIHTYEELQKMKNSKKYLCKGFVKDRSVLGKEDLLECSENKPEAVEDYIVVHLPGNDEYAPLWFKEIERTHFNLRRLRESFIAHHTKNGRSCDINKTELSFCNGKLFVA